MKTFFAVLAIFICPTFAFGDTIGPSTGCANSAYVGDTYKLNLNCSGDQLADHSIVGVADFSNRTANSISGQKDSLHSPASNSKILITGMHYVDGGFHEWSGSAGKGKSFGYPLGGEPFDSAAHEWSASADKGKSFEYAFGGEPFESAAHEWSASTDKGKSFGYASGGEPFDSAAHVWKPLLTRNESSSSADGHESDLLARNPTDDFFHYAGSFVRPASFNDRKDDGDNNRNKNDDPGKNGSGYNAKDGDDGHRGKHGGNDGEKSGGDDGGNGGGDDGGKGGDGSGYGGGDDGHTRKIPEPSSLIMLGTGLLIGGTMLRKFVA